MQATDLELARPVRGYLPGLDGVRALAVIAVMLYHGDQGLAPGGFLGVDVFFVLSGFLITSLLLDERRSRGSIHYRSFLGRRARRLLPALFVTLLGVCAYSAFVAVPPERGPLRLDALASLFYVANWRFIFSHASYFAAFGPPSPLRHMWSLAIEEQYYLVWPLLVALILRRGSRRTLLAATTALAAGSALLAVALYTPHTDPSRVYYGTDTRAQALLIGGALALALAGPGARRFTAGLREASGWIGLAVLTAMVLAVHDSSAGLYEGGLTAVAAAAGAFVVGAAGPARSRLVQLLSVAPLRHVGRISYGLYVYHWPIFVWLTPERTHASGTVLLALRVAVTFAVAELSFFLVERPVRARAFAGGRVPRLRHVGLLGAGAAATAALVVVSTSGAYSWSTYLTSTASERQYAPAGAPRALIVGDSTAFTLNFNLDAASAHRAAWNGGSVLGCGVMTTGIVFGGRRDTERADCEGLAEHWRKLVTAHDPDLVVVVTGAWEMLDQIVGGKVVAPGSPVYDAALRAAVRRAVDILSSRGAQVVFLDVPCYHDTNIADAARNDPQRRAAINAVLDRVARHDPRMSVLTWSRFLCPGGHYVDQIDGVTVRPDGVHFDAPGGHLVWKWLGPQLVARARDAQRERLASGHRRPSTTTSTTAARPSAG